MAQKTTPGANHRAVRAFAEAAVWFVRVVAPDLLTHTGGANGPDAVETRRRTAPRRTPIPKLTQSDRRVLVAIGVCLDGAQARRCLLRDVASESGVQDEALERTLARLKRAGLILRTARGQAWWQHVGLTGDGERTLAARPRQRDRPLARRGGSA